MEPWDGEMTRSGVDDSVRGISPCSCPVTLALCFYHCDCYSASLDSLRCIIIIEARDNLPLLDATIIPPLSVTVNRDDMVEL
jgi:hypothetical protein